MRSKHQRPRSNLNKFRTGVGMVGGSLTADNQTMEMKGSRFKPNNKLRLSLKNMGFYKKQEMGMESMGAQMKEYQHKIISLQNKNSEMKEDYKVLQFQVDELNEQLEAKEEQLQEAENQLNNAEEELGEANLIKATLDEQKYELAQKREEIKQLNRRISELKQDVFYRNKNVFDHNLLKLQLQNQKQEGEALKSRVRELEEECACLRIDADGDNEEPIERENHFTKKIFKLESKINELKRENEEFKKGGRPQQLNLLSSMVSNRSSQKEIYSKAKLRRNKNDIPEEEETFSRMDVKALKEKISSVELEKKIYQKKNMELIKEIEQLRSKKVKSEKMKNTLLIDDQEFKKRLNKYRTENHELKDQLQEMEARVRQMEIEKRIGGEGKKTPKAPENKSESLEIQDLKKQLTEKQRKIDALTIEKEQLQKQIGKLTFELGEKETEMKTLEYRLMGEEDNDAKVKQLIEKNSKLGERVMELESQIKRMLEMQSINSSGYPDKELEKILNE